MNITKLTAILSLSAALAAVVPAMAFADPGAEDGSGGETLGVNISGVQDVNNPSEVHQFLAQLSPEARPAVLGGCETAIANPEDTTPNVVSFCETATSGQSVASGRELPRTAY